MNDEKTNEEYSSRMLDMYFVELNKRKYMDQNDELWAWAEFLKAPNCYFLLRKKHAYYASASNLASISI